MPISEYITTLGVTLDSNLTLNKHVSSVFKSAYYSIKALRQIKPVLTCDMARAVAALTQTRLDVANSVLIGTSRSNINKLQRVQNCLAIEWYFKIGLITIHLPPSCQNFTGFHAVSKWIYVKIAATAYQSLAFDQPIYISSVLTPHQPQWSLRSAQLTRICYLCHAAAAVSDKEVFPTVPLKSGTTLSVRQSPSLDSCKHN